VLTDFMVPSDDMLIPCATIIGVLIGVLIAWFVVAGDVRPVSRRPQSK